MVDTEKGSRFIDIKIAELTEKNLFAHGR